MKVVVNKDVMLDGLQKLQSIVGTRTTLPILFNVLFKTDKDKLWLTATDLEVSIRTAVEAKVSRAGATTLPARRSFSIFRELPGNDIEIDVDDKDQASIKSGPSFFKLIGKSEDEFPPLPKFQGGRTLTLEQDLLRKMIAYTHYAVSTDDSRYILNGVMMSYKGDKLSMVATDGRRMASFQQEVEIPKESEGEWVLPSKTVGELLKTLKDEGTVKIETTENQMAFSFDNMLIVTKLIDGTFPNYRQVIPERCEERITISREELLSAIRRVALLTSDKTSSISLAFSKNKLVVSTVTPEVGEASESIAIKYSGKSLTISYNPEYLMDPLRNLAADEVFFEVTDEMSAGVIKCNVPFLYVIMPLRVR